MANVLITGCNSGFGYYTAEYFAKAGHHVFATVRKTADTTELQKLALSSPIATDSGGTQLLVRTECTVHLRQLSMHFKHNGRMSC